MLVLNHCFVSLFKGDFVEAVSVPATSSPGSSERNMVSKSLPAGRDAGTERAREMSFGAAEGWLP
jgi:hypothetical protein